MVERRYFAHDTPDGVGMADRIKRAGYLRAGRAWSLGENIAWGTDDLGTAAEIHNAWMNSAGHRANLLNPRFRHVGVGIAPGVPTPGVWGGTYVTDFGTRR